MKNYIFQYDCYQEMTHTGVKQDYCQVDVYARDEKEAEARVRKLISKKVYELIRVAEYFAPSPKRPDFMVTVQAYDMMHVDTGTLDNSRQTVVWANSPEEAVEAVRKIFKRKFYRTSYIIQKLKDEV